MQTTSATWKALWASGTAWLETKAVINSTDYTEISNPVINRALMQSGLSVGNAVSSTCQFSVRTSDSIPRSAEVIIKARLNDGTAQSEWLNAGTFYISHRRRDPVTGILELECYDAMLKSNAEYEASGSYPRAMATVVEEIADALGVDIDSRTTIETGDAYMVSLPEPDTSINAVLCGIAAVHGGNWIITAAGELRLIPLLSSAGASGEGALVVDGVIGSMSVEPTQTITGLRIATDDGQTIVGSESGLVVDIDSPYINETNAADLQTKLVGQTYQAYTLTQAVYDPAAEVGDYVRAGANNEIASIVYGEVATLGMAFRSNITALEVPELADEYPYIGKSEALSAQIRRLSVVVADKATIEDLDAMNAKLDNLSVSDIKAGIIHSADYRTVAIAMVYPASNVYPALTLFPNYGESVTSGFAIDFETGQIYGGFYSEPIAALQSSVTTLQAAVSALQSALVYPKSVPERGGQMAFMPLGALVKDRENDEQQEEEER